MSETIEVFKLDTANLLAELEKVRGASKSTQTDAQKAADGIVSSYEDVVKAIGKGEAASKKLTDTILEQEKITAEFRSELAAVEGKLKDLGSKGSAEYFRLTKSQKDLNRAIKENVADTGKLKIDKKVVDSNIKALKSQEKELKNQQKEGDKLSGVYKKLGAAVAAAFTVRAIINFAKEINETAKQIEAFDRKAEIVFGNSLPSIQLEAEKTAIAIGLTRREFVNAAAGIQDILVPLGFTRDRAAELAAETTKLAGAISQWSGGQFDAAEGAQILQKALTGEVEQLKTVGIVVDQSSKQFNERIKLLMETEGLTLQQAKALDILTQITEKSTDAQTGLAEATESISVKQAQANARFREAFEELSVALTPAVTGLTNALATAATELTFLTQSEGLGDFFDRFRIILKNSVGDFEEFNQRLAQEEEKRLQLAQEAVNRAKLLGATESLKFSSQAEANQKAAEEALNKLRELQALSNLALKKLGEEGNNDAKTILAERLKVFEAEAEAYRIRQNFIQDLLSTAISPEEEDLQRFTQQIEDLKNKVQEKVNQAELKLKISLDPTGVDELIQEIPAIVEQIEEPLLGINERVNESYEAIAKRAVEIFIAGKDAGITQQMAYEMAVKESEDRIVAYRAATAATALAATSTVLTAITGLLGEQAKENKDFALFSIALNTAAGIAGAVAAGASVGFPQNLAAIAAGIAAVLGGIAQAKQVMSGAQEFEKGTDYVKPKNSKQGRRIDDIPAWLTEGEGVATVDANTTYPGLVKAMNSKRVAEWFTQNMSTTNVNNTKYISNSTSNTGGSFSDLGMISELRKNRWKQDETNYLLKQVLVSKRFKRAG